MADIIAAMVGVLAFGTLICVWRAAWLFRHWRPAAGHVLASSYTERMQLADVPPYQGWYSRGRPGYRLAHEQVQFEDEDGARQVVWLSRWLTRRYRPFTDYVVWFDPANPSRATAKGPGWWMVMAGALIGVALAAVLMVERVNGRL